MIATLRRGSGYHRRNVVPAICVIALAGLLAGCTGTSPTGALEASHAGHGGTDASVLGQSGTGADEHAGDLQAQPGAAAAGSVSAEDAALQLEALLGQHSIVACEMMRARIRGDEDFAQSANAALGKNTDGLADLVKAVLGDSAAIQFRTLWTGHVTALFNYARGLAKVDPEARTEALTTLTTFENELAAFFAAGTQGRLPADKANAAVQAHIHHMLQQADAYAAGDYATSNKLFREAYAHTYAVGKVLAVALLGPDQTAALEKPTWRLRSELTRLLGEHVVLAVAATRSAVTNAADFSAAGDAVNANTADLTSAMDTLFGSAAAKSFMSLWAEHLEQVMAYTAGVVAKDQQRRDRALANLQSFETQFAEFLGTATGHRMASADLAKALAMHDEKLIQQIDAFAAKDYQQAHEIAYATYQHMSELASQLADAFGDTVAARLPAGGPQTGYGGMADVVGRR